MHPQPEHSQSEQTRRRAIIFANGIMEDHQTARRVVQSEDVIIAADGGARHCESLGLTPDILIGDFDSLSEAEVAALQAKGSQVIQHPRRKDYTDLELALLHTHSLGIGDVLILGALGKRWDQSLANLLLPASPELSELRIQLIDGPQEVHLLRGPNSLELEGKPGDTVSLIPVAGHASGITTRGLEYPLSNEVLIFGATRGISNVLLDQPASIQLSEGMLLCIVNHEPE